jgi:AraC-like DNA-binding protein
MDSIIYETTGDDTWVGDFNAIVLMLQVVIYFSVIFYYLSKKKHYIKENSSDAEYLQKEWIVTLMILFSVLFVIVLVSYILWPRTDAWLIQILNVIAMSYLVYNSIAHPALSDLEKVLDSKKSLEEEISSNKVTLCCEEDEVQMKDICEQVKAYLINSNAYLRCDLSLAILSKETGISQKLLSRAINGYLNRNFFELINEMRVKEVKRRLLLPENSDYTIDSIYEECGFRSRSTFFLAFKKIEGKSPAQWLNTMKD